MGQVPRCLTISHRETYRDYFVYRKHLTIYKALVNTNDDWLKAQKDNLIWRALSCCICCNVICIRKDWYVIWKSNACLPWTGAGLPSTSAWLTSDGDQTPREMCTSLVNTDITQQQQNRIWGIFQEMHSNWFMFDFSFWQQTVEQCLAGLSFRSTVRADNSGL